ncbi:hypothetical protein OROHE_026958 [Orobanche hederae]
MVGISSAVIRRQQLLIRCLGDYNNISRKTNICNNTIKMQSLLSGGGGPSLEADAVRILRSITPSLDNSRHKGQAVIVCGDLEVTLERPTIVVNWKNGEFSSVLYYLSGKIAVVGGCREYSGAPYFSAISALKIGADLSHVFCTKDAAAVIKSYSPELIVHPILEESYSLRDEDKKSISVKVIKEVDKWMERFDCLVIGPGLGRDPFLLDCVGEIMKHARQSNVPMVIDGDGLFLVTNCLELVSGYPLAVLTPNVNEYKRLVQKVLQCEVNDQDGTQQLLSLAKGIGGLTILRKGGSDFISNGETVSAVSAFGSPRRCGGQGDILSGRVCRARENGLFGPSTRENDFFDSLTQHHPKLKTDVEPMWTSDSLRFDGGLTESGIQGLFDRR